MDAFRELIKHITKAQEDIRTSIQDSEVAWLLDRSAAEVCAEYLVTHHAADEDDQRQLLYLAGRLLLILTCMQAGDSHKMMEALCLIGARNTAGFEKKPVERREAAALERKRPLYDERGYLRKHVPAVQQRLGRELHRLVTFPGLLSQALTENGAEAVEQYL
jgi:hypothetical protein